MNVNGQLGLGSVTGNVFEPMTVGLTGLTDITAGGQTSCGLAAGVPYCWGKNTDGELGIGLSGRRNTPTPLATVTYTP